MAETNRNQCPVCLNQIFNHMSRTIFKIPVIWEVYGTYSIEADTLEAAKEKALNGAGLGLPPDGNYIDDSMRLDDAEVIESLNNTCDHSFIDADNDGVYGTEKCRYCGHTQSKG